MKRFTALLAALALTITVQAQSLDECRRLARAHYPAIRQYDLIATTEQYSLSNAARSWLPQVQMSGQASYQSATATYPKPFRDIMKANGMDMPGMSKDQYRLAIDVSQNIWDGGVAKNNRGIAKAEAAEQRSSLEVTLYEVESRVNDIYFGILLLDERMAQTEAMIGVLQSNLERMRSYHRNGVAMQADVDALEAELLQAKQTMGQVESSRNSYRNMLELFIGQPLAGGTLERPTTPVIDNRTSARPELALFNAQEQRIAMQQKAIGSSVMPRFSLFAQGIYGYPGLDMFKSMMSHEWRFDVIAGVRMSWNIGAFYTRRNNLEKLNSSRQQVAIQRDVFLFNSEMQSMQQDGEVTRLEKAIEEDNRIVELRRSVRMAAESRLENGVIDTNDLLRKITDETTATLNRSTHEIELLQAKYNLKNILNR